MYEEAIQDLTDLIGFGEDNGITVVVTDGNKTGSSGRTFSFFHALVTLKNIYSTVSGEHLDQDDFNTYLEKLKENAVKETLTSVISQNIKYQSDKNYSDTVLANTAVFGQCIGYILCANVIEMMISSTRMSVEEREVDLSYSKLKIELDGAKNEDGKVLSFGLRAKFNKAVKSAARYVFPLENPVQAGSSW